MDLTTFTDTDLHDLAARISAEWERRRASAVTDATVAEVITGLQAKGVRLSLATNPSGTRWVPRPET